METQTVTKIEMETQTVKSGDSFTVTVYAEDESGIHQRNPGTVTLEREIEAETDSGKRESGSLKAVGEGKYRATFTVDDNWVSGSYSIDHIYIYDKYDNVKSISMSVYDTNRNLIPSDVIIVIDDSDATLLGDVNGDEVVDANDLTVLARHLAKIETISEDSLLKNADTNRDNTVTSDDLTYLARFVAKIIPEL